jgi:hypothetical protein
MEFIDRFVKLHTTKSLGALHEEIRRALAEEDALPPGKPRPYGVREFADFRLEADAIEAELRRREQQVQSIKW